MRVGSRGNLSVQYQLALAEFAKFNLSFWGAAKLGERMIYSCAIMCINTHLNSLDAGDKTSIDK